MVLLGQNLVPILNFTGNSRLVRTLEIKPKKVLLKDINNKLDIILKILGVTVCVEISGEKEMNYKL